MDRKKLLIALGVPAAAALLLTAALLLRSSPPEASVSKKSGAPVVEARYAPAPVQAAPPPAPPEKVAVAMDQARIRGTFQNYRHSVATNNVELQKTLLPVLLRDRDAAKKCAEDDLARAQSTVDQDIARKVLESLRR